MRSTYFFHSKGFIFAVDRVQMFLKHDETCVCKSLIELSVCRMDRCQTWNDWNFLKN